MECGVQCVMLDGIAVMLESCADNWVTVSAQVELTGFCIVKKINNIGGVANVPICGINNYMPVRLQLA